MANLGHLAPFADGNQWLDTTKVKFADQNDAASESDNADNVVRAYLFDLYPTHVLLWDATPDTGYEATPKIVREIASMLMASYRYARLYSEETMSPNDYATRLETRAMELLEKLRTGEISLYDETYESGTLFAQSDFWPNNTTVYEGTSDPLRFAKMDGKF